MDFVTRNAFHETLEQPFLAKWDLGDLRTIVRGIESTRRVSILPDRRLNPTGIHSAIKADETLLDFLERLAVGWKARTTIVGSTVYLGPPRAVGRLRTLVALRRQELLDKLAAIPESRRTHLSRGMTFRWEDLDRPADVLTRLAEQYGIAIEGREQVPHDLWASAVLPDANAIEALSLVLVQFDLTFAWIDQGRSVRIERIPERVAIDQPHNPPPGISAAEAVARWSALIPELDARVEQGKVIVSGTVETQESVEHLRRTGRLPVKSNSKPKAVPKAGPIKFPLLTLKIADTPASELMEELGQRQNFRLKFDYDRDELKAAGIDLERRISFKVKNAPIEKLLKAAFDPLGVTFEIDDRVVRLKPARK